MRAMFVYRSENVHFRLLTLFATCELLPEREVKLSDLVYHMTLAWHKTVRSGCRDVIVPYTCVFMHGHPSLLEQQPQKVTDI